jgi:predicted PhzF superfamily epimerase YddE/YHI9
MRANKGSIPYHHVDSLTEVWFRGNPPEVFLGSDLLADEIMQRIAA